MAKKHKVKAAVRREAEARLRRLARVAEVYVDGDAFKRFVGIPEINTGDKYYVEHAEFIKVKQELMKLKRVEDGDVGVITWRRFGEDQADNCLPVDTYPQSVRPGNYPINEARAAAFAGGIGVHEFECRGYPVMGVCTPIRDSLDDVVGVVELFASLVPDVFRADCLRY